jgi:hypothetical protein
MELGLYPGGTKEDKQNKKCLFHDVKSCSMFSNWPTFVYFRRGDIKVTDRKYEIFQDLVNSLKGIGQKGPSTLIEGF